MMMMLLTILILFKTDPPILVSVNFVNRDSSHSTSSSVTSLTSRNPLDLPTVSLKADKKLDAICQSKGSKPPAVISWTLNGKDLKDAK